MLADTLSIWLFSDTSAVAILWWASQVNAKFLTFWIPICSPTCFLLRSPCPQPFNHTFSKPQSSAKLISYAHNPVYVFTLDHFSLNTKEMSRLSTGAPPLWGFLSALSVRTIPSLGVSVSAAYFSLSPRHCTKQVQDFSSFVSWSWENPHEIVSVTMVGDTKKLY
jgi:hypothetical protein